jgi:hypothetical protein
MLRDLIPPSKDTFWQTGLKTKIQKSFVYRKPTSMTETSTDFTKPMAPKNRQEKQYLSQTK